MSTIKQDATHSLLSEGNAQESEKCFIIQPFEHTFIERCEEYFKPAIKEAGLLPYRVDEHYEPEQLLKINVIYKEIQNALVCLADITVNNPNVWYEFGFADGKEIPVVLICDKEARKNLPFDVNQRDVYFYRSDSSDGLLDLRNEITRRIRITAAEATKRRTSVDSKMVSQMKDFRGERVRAIKEQELPVKLPSSAPTVAFHIIPVHGFSEEKQIDFDAINLNELQVPVGGFRRNNVDGICWYHQEGGDDLGEGNGEYAQLFQQTGVMEYVGTFRILDHVPSEHKTTLPSLLIMLKLIRVLHCYIGNLRKFNFGVPPWHLFLGFSLLDVEGYFLAPKSRSIWFDLEPADRPDFILPLDDRRVSSEDDAITTLYPLLNRLWRAFNYEKCPYDESELNNWMMRV